MTRLLLIALVGLALAAPPAAAAPARQTIQELTIGASTQGRPITALRVGDGPRKLVVVGNTHGAPEANTYVLATMLAEHYRANPQEVPPGVRLYIIPTLNPDGLALGTRFNARGVDLNRNMDTGLDACPENDWQTTVFGAYGVVSDTGGPYGDSEVESRLIRAFLLDAWGAIFLHSSAGNVFPASCEHAPSIALAQVYAEGGGYVYSRFWEAYTITGGMHDWAAALGIAAVIPELVTGTEPEFEQNLAGLRAVLARAEELLPPPADGLEAGVAIPAPIWRAWRMLGGAARLGLPLGPATSAAGVTHQRFERGLLELRPELADTPYLVQLAPLGRQYAGSPAAAAPCDPTIDGCRLFPETGHTLRGLFATFWERGGGLQVFGYPISEEFRAPAADGTPRLQQVFERAVLALGDDGSVRLEPLGWLTLVRERSQAPTQVHQVR